MKSTLFHGSIYSDIETFRPFSHFGTELAALQAIVNKINDTKNYPHKYTNIQIVPTLYEIEFDESELNLLQTDDWGAPGIIGTARGIGEALESIYSKESSVFTEINKIRENLITKKSEKGENYKTYGIKIVSDFLIKLNYHGMKYINVLEGCEDSESVCFIKAELFVIKNKIPVNQAQLADAEKILRQPLAKKIE